MLGRLPSRAAGCSAAGPTGLYSEAARRECLMNALHGACSKHPPRSAAHLAAERWLQAPSQPAGHRTDTCIRAARSAQRKLQQQAVGPGVSRTTAVGGQRLQGLLWPSQRQRVAAAAAAAAAGAGQAPGTQRRAPCRLEPAAAGREAAYVPHRRPLSLAGLRGRHRSA